METQAEKNRREFEDTATEDGPSILQVIDLFKREFGAKVRGAENRETGYAVGEDLG